MDYLDTERELREKSEKQRGLCEDYEKIRKDFGVAKYNLFVLLTPKQDEKEYRKASLEKQLLMLRRDTQENHKKEVYDYFEKYITLEQEYKGLEKLIDAYASRISSLQSLMRWQRTGETGER